jgi:hypothetical protein
MRKQKGESAKRKNNQQKNRKWEERKKENIFFLKTRIAKKNSYTRIG